MALIDPNPTGLAFESARLPKHSHDSVFPAQALARLAELHDEAPLGSVRQIVTAPERLAPAIADALKYDERALVEELVGGTELTVAVIGNDELTPLPVIEIVTKREFFDYTAKYSAGESEEIVPARIPDDVARRAQDIAVRAHKALGCRGMSRTDLMWAGDRMVTLEVNTIPGMTANSLLPKAARAAGIQFGDLLARFVDWALEDARRRAR